MAKQKNPEAPEVEKSGNGQEQTADVTAEEKEKKAGKAPEKKPEPKPEAKAEPAGEPAAPAEAAPSAEETLAAEKDKYLRLLAEYDNFRRRSAKARESIYPDVRCDTLKKFLPVYDSLSRALSQTAEDDPARKGLEMIMTQFETALTQLGVTMIEAVGQAFDANLHNAVMHVEDESVGESVVIEEFEKGFRVGDKILRYSMVKVAN